MPIDWNQLIPTRKSLLVRLKDWDDQKSWQDFYDIYARLIYGAAVKAGLTESEAEDVVQETVIGVCKAIGNYEYRPEKCAFKTWLHAVTKRQVANQFRKRLGKGRLLEPLPAEADETAQFNEISDPASQALDNVFQREWEQTLLDAACERVKRQVSPEQFQIYDYYAVQGHGTLDTVRALGVSPAKVYIAKNRVGKMVREQVAHLRNEYV
jgi:RNA polymerase sigma factor (sigma-70 family)